MNDFVFVIYNLKLKDRQVQKSIEMDNFENAPSDDEWIANEGVNYNEGMHEDEDDDGEGDFVIVDEDRGEGDDREGEGDDGHNESMQLEEEQLEEDEDEDEDEDEEEAIQHFDDNEFY